VNLTNNEIYSIKLTSGEELVTKVLRVEDNEVVVIQSPLSVAPGPQGFGLVTSLYTADPKSEARINSTGITIMAPTEATIRAKYIEATTGIKLPAEKKIILG